MQLILSQFKNSLRPAYTDFHITQSILIDYTTHTGGGKKGNRDGVGIASVTKVVFPLYPHVSNILHCLLPGLRRTHIDTQTEPLSCHTKRPSGLALILPSPFLPALSPLLWLFARHLIFLFNNQPWKCVGRKMSKYRCSHNSSHHECTANSPQHNEETKQSDALPFADHYWEQWLEKIRRWTSFM